MGDKLETDKFYKTDAKNDFKKIYDKGVPAHDFASFIRKKASLNPHLKFFSEHYEEPKAAYSKIRMFPFDKLHAEEVAQILSKCVVKVYDDIIVLNKPNGLSVVDVSGKTRSIQSVLKELADELKIKETLHIIHRLDKDTTGVLLLAKNAETAHLLKQAFKKGLIRKNYLCLTHGIPLSASGIIDFPLKEMVTDSRTIIKPDFKYITKRCKRNNELSGPLCTAYKVVDSNYGISFIQCASLSGDKHQIRAHLAYGLGTPIIGDHKYATLMNDKRAELMPQELSKRALVGLKIPSGKVRYLPVHLHAFTLQFGSQPGRSKRGFDAAAPLVQDLNKDIDFVSQEQCLDQLGVTGMKLYANLPDFFVSRLKRLRMYNFKQMTFLLKNML